MTKADFLDLVKNEHQLLESALAEIPLEEMEVAGVAGGGNWTVKDLIAHLSWYQREMVGVLQAHALVGSPRWDWPIEQRNEAIFLENRERPLEEIREEARGTFTQLLGLLETSPEADLFDPCRFPGMPPEWQPWEVIASNTYEHDDAHLPQLRAWLERKRSP